MKVMTCLVNRTFSDVGSLSRTLAPSATGRTAMDKEAFDEGYHGLNCATIKNHWAVGGVKIVNGTTGQGEGKRFDVVATNDGHIKSLYSYYASDGSRDPWPELFSRVQLRAARLNEEVRCSRLKGPSCRHVLSFFLF